MRNPDEIVADILHEFRILETTQFDDLRSEGWAIPPSIYIEDRLVFITRKSLELFAELSGRLIKDHRRESDFTIEEWNKTVRRVAGPILYQHANSDSRTDINIVATEIDRRIRIEVDGVEYEYAFGCHFGDILDLGPVVIGPVRFESRLEWLSRRRRDGVVSAITQRRFEKAWQGSSLRKRKWSRDAHVEKSVLDMTKNSGSVCSASVRPMGSEMGLQKALVSARLAITAVALAWQTPSKTLNNINLTYDRVPHNRNYFASTLDGLYVGGSAASYLPGGVRVKLEEWKEIRPQFDDMFECVGKTIYAVSHSSKDIKHSDVVRSLHLSLLWFHAACRETVDTMAVAKFWFSLDALAKGYAPAIGLRSISVTDLVRRMIKPDGRGKERLEEDLNRIHAMRNSMSHGSNNSSELGHDCSVLRWHSEHLTRICLISSMEALHPAISKSSPMT